MLNIKQKQKKLDSIHIGDFIIYNNVTYKIIAYGKNRATGKDYFILNNNTILKEDVWNEIKIIK